MQGLVASKCSLQKMVWEILSLDGGIEATGWEEDCILYGVMPT